MATRQKTIHVRFGLALFFFHGLFLHLVQHSLRFLWLPLHRTVQSVFETKIASAGVITEGFYA